MTISHHNSVSDDTLTQQHREGVARFDELVAEYRRMRGVTGDALQADSVAIYTGLIADAFHWAAEQSFDLFFAMSEAYQISVRESAE